MSFFPARTPGLCCQHHRASRVLSKLWERLKALMNFLKYFFYFFILGCARCLLLCEFLSSCDEQGPLSSWGVRAACWGGLSCRRARARGAQAAAAAARGLGSCSSRGSRAQTSACGHTGLAAPWQVGSSRPRGPTSVSYTGGPHSLPLSQEGSPD